MANAEAVLAETMRRFPDNTAAAIDFAEVAARRGDWPEVHQRWAYVREKFPNEKAGWIRGGVTHLRYGDLALAERLLAHSVSLFPDDAHAAIEYAYVATKRSDWPEVHQRWARVREKFPNEKAGWISGGVAHLRYGDLTLAERLLSYSTSQFPEDAHAAVEYAHVAAKRGDWAEAHQRWARVREKFPNEKAGWINGGVAHLRHGDLELAERLLAHSLSLFPEDAYAAVEYAHVAVKRGDWPEVHQRWARVRETFPGEKAGWTSGGVTHLRYGDLALAERLLSHAVTLFPDDAHAAVEYALVATKRSDWPEVHQRWARVREKFPNEKAGWISGGVAHLRYGDLALAERLLSHSISQFPEDAHVAFEYAHVAAKRGDWTEVHQRWARVREKFPNEKAGWTSGGVAHLRYGDLALAERLLSHAVSLFPDDAHAAVEYAHVAVKRSDWPEVHQRWARVRETFPNEKAGWISGGVAHLRYGDLALAERLLASSVQRFPEDLGAAVDYAEVAMKRQQWSDATKRWDDVRKRFPGERTGWIRGAQAYLRDGNHEDAEALVHDLRQSCSDPQVGTIAARISFRILLDRVVNEQDHDRCHAQVDTILEEPVDWTNAEFLPVGVEETLGTNFNPNVERSIKHQLSQGLSRQLSVGIATDAGQVIALCLDLLSEAQTLDSIIPKYIASSGYKLFGHIFDLRNVANVDALLRWARRAVATSEAIPLEAQQAFQVILFLESHDHELAMVFLEQYCRRSTRRNGDVLTDLLENVLSVRHRHENLQSPAIVDSPSRPLRIALCISGQLRGFEQALSTWSFLDHPNYHVDRFVHVWRSIGRKFPTVFTAHRAFPAPIREAFIEASSLLGQETVVQNFPTLFGYLRSGGDVATTERLKALYATTHVQIEDDTDNQFSGFTNTTKMYYKIWQCHRLALNTKNKYDLIIRIRPDLALQSASNIDFERIYFDCTKQRLLFSDLAPRFERHGYYIGDQFALSTPEGMSSYADSYNLTLQAIAGRLPDFPRRFQMHQNIAHAAFRSGVRVMRLEGVGFGPLLDPSALTTDQIRELVSKDVGDQPRNVADELFINACTGTR